MLAHQIRTRYLGYLTCVTALMTALIVSGCERSDAPLPRADGLTIVVTQNAIVSNPPQPATRQVTQVYANTISSQEAVDEVEADFDAMHVVQSNESYNCPADTLPYYSYALSFTKGGKPIVTAQADITACQFWHTGSQIRCCATQEFWVSLQKTTGAPPPPSSPIANPTATVVLAPTSLARPMRVGGTIA